MRAVSLLRRGLVCHFVASRAFASATMTKPLPPSAFKLDKSIFNEALYTRVRAFWFADLPLNFTGPNPVTLKRWWGLDATKAEKQEVDTFCRNEFLTAIESIGPEQLQLPSFESHEAEVESASTIASPLLAQVEGARSHQESADTLLSLTILLDQATRNIFRTQATLPLIYNHYDRLAHALLRSCMKLDPSPVTFPPYMGRPALQQWLLMPLIHSEDLSSHELWDSITSQMDAKVPIHDVAAKKYLEQGRIAEEKHLDPLKKFGRYPHRNACLYRKSSPEEKEWLSKGETFGVSQGKDEL